MIESHKTEIYFFKLFENMSSKIHEPDMAEAKRILLTAAESTGMPEVVLAAAMFSILKCICLDHININVKRKQENLDD